MPPVLDDRQRHARVIAAIDSPVNISVDSRARRFATWSKCEDDCADDLPTGQEPASDIETPDAAIPPFSAVLGLGGDDF